MPKPKIKNRVFGKKKSKELLLNFYNKEKIKDYINSITPLYLLVLDLGEVARLTWSRYKL